MKIKKVDDKPLIIHTKEKTEIHVKGKQETKLKGRNVLTVTRAPKIVNGEGAEDIPGKKGVDIAEAVRKKRGKRGGGQIGEKDIPKEPFYEEHFGSTSAKPDSGAKRTFVRNSGNNNTRTVSYRFEGKCGSGIMRTVGEAGAETAARQMEGGDEICDACMVIDTLTASARNPVHSGRELYRRQLARKEEQRTKKTGTEQENRKKESVAGVTADCAKMPGQEIATSSPKSMREVPQKTARDMAKASARDAAKEKIKKVSKEAEKKAAKETIKKTARTTAKAAAATAGTAAAGPGGILAGIAAGEAVNRELDRRNIRSSSWNRMIQVFVSKLRQEEGQDNIGKALKDIVMLRFLTAAKYAVKYTAFFLAGMFSAAVFTALPVLVILAVIYNSPLAVFFPSISSAETTQEVLSSYVAEFDRDVELEMLKTRGYDRVKKLYVSFSGEGTPDNYCDILAVYMVKHGNGDTATDMTDKAKENLREVFDDMCSYKVSKKTETEKDEEGNTVNYKVKYVEITLKTYQDMIPLYGFDEEEQEMLAELMKPENLAMMGYEGPSGGQEISPDKYQAVMDAVSGANGKSVLKFALSKVGCPYSQELRDSGTHFDCSSLAYYAWRHAGVNISFYGSTTAAAEGQLCHDNDWLVQESDMQPGDLIFYSYEKNGRFMDISHVAIYAGDGMVVEAANTRLGVVYRPIHGRSSIVMVGRPR